MAAPILSMFATDHHRLAYALSTEHDWRLKHHFQQKKAHTVISLPCKYFKFHISVCNYENWSMNIVRILNLQAIKAFIWNAAWRAVYSSFVI